jgi:hypothetical protein
MRFVPQPRNPDSGGVLRLVTERAQLLTRGTGAALALGHQRGMLCRATVGKNAPKLGCWLNVTDGLSAECVRTGKALRCDDSANDPRVDAEICGQLGIRSILAAPIPFEGEIVGLLEVFSSQRFAFHDGDLAVIESLAETALPSPRFPETTPPPNLLIEPQPAHRVFLDNLTDIVRPRQTEPLHLTSQPARFWPDVFVPSQLPWEQFLQSMLLQLTMLVILLGVVKFGAFGPHLVPRAQLRFSNADVIYYVPSEYLPLIKKARPTLRSQPSLTSFRQAALSVRRGSQSAAPKPVAPPSVHPMQDLRMGIASRNPTLPAVPMLATMRQQLVTPAANLAAVAPPPDTSALSRGQHFAAAAPAVISPPPSTSLTHSVREMASLSIGQLQVVGPAPQMPIHHQSLAFGKSRGSLGGTQLVVPPAPGVSSLQNAARSRIGTLPDAQFRVVPPAPALQLASTSLNGGHGGQFIGVVPPPPAIQGLNRSGNQYASSLPGSGAQVVPPAPSLSAASAYSGRTNGGFAASAVPPMVSIDHLKTSGLGHPSSTRAGDFQVAAPVPAQKLGKSGNGGEPITMASALPGGLLPGEIVPSTVENFEEAKDFPDAKALNVNFVGPALVLPASSYFLSYEVFIAEEHSARHQSRLIKLVYDFLPYQPRLSDYGPNYPAIENLHATRDPSCDETLMQAESSAKTVRWSAADRAQLSAKSAKQRQSNLPCYRTTADDFRRARAHHSN